MEDSGKYVTVELTKDEYMILHNALGEVCNGPYAIEDWEFHTLIGATKKETEQLLHKIIALEKKEND